MTRKPTPNGRWNACGHSLPRKACLSLGQVIEIGSGLNGHRRQILKLLADPTLTVLVVEHRDRLARFGVELISTALEAQGRRIVVINETESKDGLVQDMTDVLTSLCARLYGQRGAASRAKRALKAVEQA